MERKSFSNSLEGAVGLGLEKLSGSRRVKRSNTWEASDSYLSGNCEEEDAPLVPKSINREDERKIAPLQNPAVEYEVESTMVFEPPADGAEPPTSNTSTLMHLVKGNVGTGILTIPNAVSNAGLLVGTLGLPILGIICIHCMHLLVNNNKVICRKIGCRSLDYAGTAEQAFRIGPKAIQRYAKVARFAVNSMLMLTQFGFCCVYYLFVSTSIYEVVHNITHGQPLTVTHYMTIILIPMIGFNWIRSLKNITPMSSFANVLQVFGLFTVFYYLFKDLPKYSPQPISAPLAKLPLYFGTAMYSFEGIGVVLPLENKMATPDDFRGWNGVLNTGMIIVTCFYTAIGFFGYLRYGDDIKPSITFNLEESVLSEVIRLNFAVAIFLSYPLQFYVPVKIIWPVIHEKFGLIRFTEKTQRIFEYIFRTCLVLMTFLLAAAIPMLDLFISLIGAFASSSLALIFPPIIEIVVIWNSDISKTKFRLILAKDILIIACGMFGFSIGTYTSIKAIVDCFQTNCTAKKSP